MSISVNHISFTVSDIDRSIDFYQRFLFLKLIDKGDRDKDFSRKVTGIKDAHLKIAYLAASNCFVELVQYLSPKGIQLDTKTCNIGSSHICFVVDNYHETVNSLKKNNIKLSGEPAIVPLGPNKGRAVLYFKDPDSNNIEIISSTVVK